ncbi:MAG: hypothetical protein ACQER6_00665 [Pseudomonadota bacterium]
MTDQFRDLLVCRSRHDDAYRLYRVDPAAENLFLEVPVSSGAKIDHRDRMAQVGGYLLQWGPRTKIDGIPGYRYALRQVDPRSSDPRGGPVVQSGFWQQKKFWGYRAYYSDDPDEGRELDLLPLV